MKLYNFLTKKIEAFRPIKKGIVKMYACGPTVYNFAHIGNLRTYVFEDILRRALEMAGFKVKLVINITDVEDKIIRESKKSGKPIQKFVAPYEQAFFEDIKALNIKPAGSYPRATEHIKEMVVLINRLLARGFAYESGGSIYFDISRFKKYGKLSGVEKRELKAGSRIDMDEYTKENAQDFVLWKGAKPGEPSWNEEFKIPRRRTSSLRDRQNSKFKIPGRPGWHIECSAMSIRYLGKSFDIHAGGIDLLFPHHENEIAQSEGASNKPFARFFIEGGHLLVDGQKMSKSLGNLYTLRDFEKQGFDPLAFRYLLLTAHYRSNLNFTRKSLEAAESALRKIQNRVLELRSAKNIRGSSHDFRQQFKKAVSGDLDTPKALAIFWKNFEKLTLDDIFWADRILGLDLKNLEPVKIPAKIKKLAEEREEARKSENWKRADKIRAQIQKLGWQIGDSSSGPVIRRSDKEH